VDLLGHFREAVEDPGAPHRGGPRQAQEGHAPAVLLAGLSAPVAVARWAALRARRLAPRPEAVARVPSIARPSASGRIAFGEGVPVNRPSAAPASIAVTILLLLAACGEPKPATTTATGRVTYSNGVRQLIEKRCAKCHGPSSPTMAEFDRDKERYKAEKRGPRYDTYENLMVVVNGSDTGALMRRLDDGTGTKDGKPGNMHEHLGDDDAERAANLALLKRWIGGWTLKRATEISEAERAAILAPRE
jgi:hypothetical protein